MRPKGSGLKKTSNFVIKVIERRLRGVAQPGSATVLGTVGRKFESCRPDHFVINHSAGFSAFARYSSVRLICKSIIFFEEVNHWGSIFLRNPV